MLDNGQIFLTEQRLGRWDRRIEVVDTGIGIPADQLHHIFDEFHQVGRDRQQRDEGLGLGLAIVQRIAKLLRTDVDVMSALGEGSTFAFALAKSEPTVYEPNVTTISASTAATQATVLLVDDDPAVPESSLLLLEIEGFDVAAAASPAAAYAQVEQLAAAPAIIVTDYHLGSRETGVDVVRRVRERVNYSVPAILVTGDTSPVIDDIAVNNMHLIAKPIKPEQLLELMRQLIIV